MSEVRSDVSRDERRYGGDGGQAALPPHRQTWMMISVIQAVMVVSVALTGYFIGGNRI